MKYFICVLGLALVIEGLPYFAFPGKIKEFLAKIPQIQDTTLRIFGLATIMLGLLLIYISRETEGF